MGTWYKLELGHGQMAFAPRRAVSDAWMAAAMTAARTGSEDPGNAVFASGNSMNIMLFFTPQAEMLARAFHGSPSDKPPEDRHLRLEVGDARAWEIHFPGFVQRRRDTRGGAR